MEWTSNQTEIDADTIKECILRMAKSMEDTAIIADFGCGAADYWYLLRELKISIVGVSYDHEDQRGKEKGIRVITGELEDFNFLGVFDGFIAVNIMEKIQPELWTGALLRFERSMKTDGIGLIVTSLSEDDNAWSVYSQLKSNGFPVVVGEYIEGNEYRYKPLKSWYHQWLKRASFYTYKEVVVDSLVYSLVKK